MDGPDSSLWFKINEDRGSEVVYFKRRNGRLWKLGDGTFGIVYVVHSELRGNDFAVKLLYNNESTVPRLLSRMPKEAVAAITQRVVEEAGSAADFAAQFNEIVLQNYRRPDSLVLALARADLPGWDKCLESIRKRANSAAVDRFNRESTVSRLMRDDQLRRKNQAQISGTVDIIGSTQRFQSYPAYQQLKPEFDAMGLSVSDYALVMEKYDCSLKDLLERRPGEAFWIAPSALAEGFETGEVPAALTALSSARGDLERALEAQHGLAPEQRQRLRDAIEAPPEGYELLKRMTFEDRIRTALPFLRDIVVGLSRLHRVSYAGGGPLFHLDIKPANIYIRHDDAKGIVCALGDLGFLPLEPQHDQTADTSIDELPLGSLHFRSPEQKEHFDVANVEIDIRDNGVFLDIRDPKFAGSFIEKGDSVIFSRDNTRFRHVIEEIVPATANAWTRVKIGTQVDPGLDGEQTQVLFLKRQEYRTDLFGVGAIAFDLISCGRSAERFYESIRRFEFDGSERGSVESTAGKYRRVKDGLADEPELIHIFEPFRRGSDYAPEAFVELILRCMLYKADKTFYAPYEAQLPSTQQIMDTPHFEDPRSKAITGVLAYIDNDLDYKNNAYALENPLVTLKLPKPPATKVDRLETIINRLQDPNYDWKLRLAQGAYYYEKLATLVQERNRAPDRPFLYQMLPAGIRWLQENEQAPFQFAYSAYTTQRDYENDLVSGDMDKMLRAVTHPFVPTTIAFARREIMLTRLRHNGAAAASGGERCALRFLDAASHGRARVGDWIVHRTLDEERRLWRITETLDSLGRDHIIVAPIGGDSPALFAGTESQVEVLFYSRLVPAKYYLDVLGLYLLNFLVANSPLTTNNREKIDVETLGEGVAGNGSQPARLLENFLSRRRRNGLKEIFETIAEIYVKLTCHASPTSYYGKTGGDATDGLEPSAFMLEVVNDAKDLRNQVEDFLSVPRNTFENEHPADRRLQHVSQSVELSGSAMATEPIDIKPLLLEARGRR